MGSSARRAFMYVGGIEQVEEQAKAWSRPLNELA